MRFARRIAADMNVRLSWRIRPGRPGCAESSAWHGHPPEPRCSRLHRERTLRGLHDEALARQPGELVGVLEPPPEDRATNATREPHLQRRVIHSTEAMFAYPSGAFDGSAT